MWSYAAFFPSPAFADSSVLVYVHGIFFGVSEGPVVHHPLRKFWQDLKCNVHALCAQSRCRRSGEAIQVGLQAALCPPKLSNMVLAMFVVFSTSCYLRCSNIFATSTGKFEVVLCGIQFEANDISAYVTPLPNRFCHSCLWEAEFPNQILHHVFHVLDIICPWEMQPGAADWWPPWCKAQNIGSGKSWINHSVLVRSSSRVVGISWWFCTTEHMWHNPFESYMALWAYV